MARTGEEEVASWTRVSMIASKRYSGRMDAPPCTGVRCWTRLEDLTRTFLPTPMTLSWDCELASPAGLASIFRLPWFGIIAARRWAYDPGDGWSSSSAIAFCLRRNCFHGACFG